MFIFYEKNIFTKNNEAIFAVPDYNFRVELYDVNYHLLDFLEMQQRHTNAMTLQDIYHWKVTCAYGTGLFHRKTILQTGIQWDTSLQIFDDWDFIMQLGNHFPQGFFHVPNILYEYYQRYGTDGACSTNGYATFAQSFGQSTKSIKMISLCKGKIGTPD